MAHPHCVCVCVCESLSCIFVIILSHTDSFPLRTERRNRANNWRRRCRRRDTVPSAVPSVHTTTSTVFQFRFSIIGRTGRAAAAHWISSTRLVVCPSDRSPPSGTLIADMCAIPRRMRHRPVGAGAAPAVFRFPWCPSCPKAARRPRSSPRLRNDSVTTCSRLRATRA